MFRAATDKYQDVNDMKTKTYEEILEEYEKFFSLDEEIQQNQSNNQKSKGEISGMNIIRTINLSFAKSISGFNQSVQNKRFMLCTTCTGKKV